MKITRRQLRKIISEVALLEAQDFNMYEPLSLSEPINKIINAIIDSVKSSTSAGQLHSNTISMIILAASFISSSNKLSEKQSFYLASAILRYHSKMIMFKKQINDEFEKKYYKTMTLDSPEMDKWREIDASQVEFHREVESMVGTCLLYTSPSPRDH